ncbi:ABC transporter substrate-binding protein [Flammeovirgaceae bacterium SG7u.111]|nr:ABC transporter substrate-binding protein [Flammeovirgaceae bacterium SG7u.132]WPO35509.1 ABC transporter substrate-binding protein [Flammeovirgaceae bacterium SG7u.111]
MKLFPKLLLVSLALFQSCSFNSNKGDEQQFRLGKGDRYYGGVFRLSEPEYIKSLYPPSIIDVYSYRVASQVYEGLFKFNQQNITELEHGLIEKYEIDETKTVYTFHLKKGIYFHDNECFEGGKGREVTAEDIAYCFTNLCTPNRLNQNFNLFENIVKGANEYYDTIKNGGDAPEKLEGFEVVDKYTLKITINKPNSIFLYNLARPGSLIYPKEAYEKYGEEMRIKAVGTGPFRLSSVDEGLAINLVKNERYYGVDEFGNKLPFLEALSIQFLKDKKVELLEFKKGNLDMMYRLPTDYIIDILDNPNAEQEFELQREPEMSTQILAMNNNKGIFSDANVRKAFSFALDKERILDYVLNGEAYSSGKHGFTPPSFSNYDITGIEGYTFNPDSAKFYLQKAGYPNGTGFPTITLDLNAEGERYTNVAVEVQKQLKDYLNIEIELNIAPIAHITEKTLSGNFDLVRLAWVADYPSPEIFLWMFYSQNIPDDPSSKSYPNLIRYKNEEVDMYYEKALNAFSEKEALENFMKAEKLMMQDAPILVLWYDESYRLLQSYIKNFPNNPMQYRDFSQVYMIPHEKKANIVAADK